MTADLFLDNVLQFSTGEAKHYDDAYILELYQQDADRGFSCAYVKYHKMLFAIARKFFSLTDADKRSLVLESLFKALSTYSIESTANFATYVTHVTKNSLANEVRKYDAISRKLPEGFTMEYFDKQEQFTYTGCGSDLYNKLGEDDYRLTDIEFLDCINVLSLNDKEYKYISMVMEDSRVPKVCEICRELGIERYQLPTFKKKLARKLLKAIQK